MFGKKVRDHQAKKRRDQSRLKQYKFSEEQGAALTRRLNGIAHIDMAGRPLAVQDLHTDAKHQLALIRQSIADRTHYDFNSGDGPAEGDIATWLAEDVTGVMRENSVNPQTLLECLTDQLPDVHFTVDWYDVTTMVAAMMREMHLAGVLKGLELSHSRPGSGSAEQ